VRIDHPAAGSLDYPAAPFKMSITPFRTGRAPLLGEHNEEIYGTELGIGAGELRRLQREGVI
jgi:crotonobetainyl-CoA:carnitine CoA-transferase CaiB-like acyl-CoA transferase